MQKRGRLLGFVVVALAAAMAGASGTAALAPSTDAAPAVPGDAAQTTLRVGYLPIAGNMDLLVARDRGWFAEEGIAVELSPMAGGAEILPALIGGSLGLGTLNVVTHVLALDPGFRARAVAGGLLGRRGEP